MKKFFSLLLTTVLALSMVATTAFAAESTGNVSIDISTNTAKVGDTFTVTVNSAAKIIAVDGFNVSYDPEEVELISVADATGWETEQEFILTYKGSRSDTPVKLNFENNTAESKYAWYYSSGDDLQWYACDGFAVMTFKVKEGTEGQDIEIKLNENSSSKGENGNGYNSGVEGYQYYCDVETVTVEGNEPEEKITNDDTPSEVVAADGTNRKVWDITVSAGLAKNDTLKAVLSHETAGTQDVAIKFADGVVDGDLDIGFSLSVKFQDWTKAAATTLEVVKVAAN